jgi:aspartate aminotransferase
VKDLSKLVQSVPTSATGAVSDKARRVKAAGRDVISLAAGDPDFATPAHIMDAAVDALRAGDTHYQSAKGKPALVDAIVAKLARENGISVKPAQVVVTPGAKWALYVTLAALLNPGDEVLILDPAWVSYAPMVTLIGGRPVHVTLPSAENFRVTEALLRRHLTPQSKVLLVNSPNNPTGRVLSRAETQAIVNVATEHDLYAVSDEVYEHLVYDDAQHHSLAAEPGMAERTITVNGFSKTYAMTGWRLGWLAAPVPVARQALKVQSQSVVSATSFGMAGGIAALNGPQDVVHEMVAAYAARRRFMLQALDDLPGVECGPVEGAFYLFTRFPNSSRNSLELADTLLDEADIAATPGIAFGESGEGYLRFTFATGMADLERAVERLWKIVPDL